MATATLKKNKKGEQYYEIMAYRAGKSRLSTRWYVPNGWSAKSIERELERQKADFQRKADAGEVLSKKEQKREQLQAAAEAAKIQTLKQYGECVFMPAKEDEVSENTRAYYQGMLDKHIYPYIGELKIVNITAADITAVIQKARKGKLSHSTITGIYTTMHQVFKSAYLKDVIERNPMDKVQKPRQTKEKLKDKAVEAYTNEEIKQIIRCLQSEKLKWRAYVMLAIDSGGRRGEICGLKWKSVDFKKGTITIENNLLYTKAKGIYETTPKSGKAREIDVSPEVLTLLKYLRDEQAESGLSQYVFTENNSAEPMHPQTPTRYFERFGNKYGIEHFHPHKLRHSFASIAITNGADIASVSEKLGHANKKITLQMYTHADAESIKRAGNIFREAICEAK